MDRTHAIVGVVGLAIGWVAHMVVTLPAPDFGANPKPVVTPAPSFKVGDLVETVVTNGKTWIAAGYDIKALDEFDALNAKGADPGTFEMVASGRAMQLQGDRAGRVAAAGEAVQIHMLEGFQKGKDFVVWPKNLKPLAREVHGREF